MTEDSIITTFPVGGEEERLTEMSTIGREVATITWEEDGGEIVVEATSGDFDCSTSISSPPWTRSS